MFASFENKKSSRADLVGAVVTYGVLRRGCLDFSVTSSPLYLPRIPSGGDIAGRPWQGCHVTPEPTAVPAPTPAVTEPEPEKKPDQMTAIIALAAIVLLGGGGAIFMLKNKGKGGKNRADNDFVMDDDDDESDEEEPNQE